MNSQLANQLTSGRKMLLASLPIVAVGPIVFALLNTPQMLAQSPASGKV
jgi:hypothetical protein